MLRAVKYFKIFVPKPAQQQEDSSFRNIRYSLFRPTLAIFKEVVNKDKIGG